MDLSNKYEFGVREKVNGVVGTAMKASFTDMPNDTHNAETSNLAFDIRNIISECRCSVFVGVFLGDEQIMIWLEWVEWVGIDSNLDSDSQPRLFGEAL